MVDDGEVDLREILRSRRRSQNDPSAPNESRTSPRTTTGRKPIVWDLEPSQDEEQLRSPEMPQNQDHSPIECEPIAWRNDASPASGRPMSRSPVNFEPIHLQDRTFSRSPTDRGRGRSTSPIRFKPIGWRSKERSPARFNSIGAGRRSRSPRSTRPFRRRSPSPNSPLRRSRSPRFARSSPRRSRSPRRRSKSPRFTRPIPPRRSRSPRFPRSPLRRSRSPRRRSRSPGRRSRSPRLTRLPIRRSPLSPTRTSGADDLRSDLQRRRKSPTWDELRPPPAPRLGPLTDDDHVSRPLPVPSLNDVSPVHSTRRLPSPYRPPPQSPPPPRLHTPAGFENRLDDYQEDRAASTERRYPPLLGYDNPYNAGVFSPPRGGSHHEKGSSQWSPSPEDRWRNAPPQRFNEASFSPPRRRTRSPVPRDGGFFPLLPEPYDGRRPVAPGAPPNYFENDASERDSFISSHRSPMNSNRLSPYRSPPRGSPIRRSPIRISPIRRSPIRRSPIRRSPIRRSPPIRRLPDSESLTAAAPPPSMEWTPVEPKKKPGKKKKEVIPTCLACGIGNHYVNVCKVFKFMTSKQRWTYVEQNDACAQCLCFHDEGQCKSPNNKCGYQGCEASHHHLLHFTKEENRTSMYCVCCGSSKHALILECPSFVGRGLNKRKELIQQFPDICINCLKPDHMLGDCKGEKACNIDGCTLNHHPYLHGIQEEDFGQKIPNCQACGAIDEHYTYADCPMFIDMSLQFKMEILKQPKACKSCLRQLDHASCEKLMPCLVDGCIKLHHPLLHGVKEAITRAQAKKKARPVICFVCDAKSHHAPDCYLFLKMNVANRWIHVRKAPTNCSQCLKMGHTRDDCKSNLTCTISGCSGDHHWLLHEETTPKPEGCFKCKEADHAFKDCPLRKCQNCRSFEHRTRDCIKCMQCNLWGHHLRDCPQKKRVICRRCGASGHQPKDCPETRQDEESALSQSTSFRSVIVCYNCSTPGHHIKDCPDPIRPELEITCYNCYEKGHHIDRCPKPRNQPHPDKNDAAVAAFQKKGIVCYNCQQPGHHIKDCPKPRPEITCYNCLAPGHHLNDCPQGPRMQTAKNVGGQVARNCFNCLKYGHNIKDCPELGSKSSMTNQITCFKCLTVGHHARQCPKETCKRCGKAGHTELSCQSSATAGGGGGVMSIDYGHGPNRVQLPKPNKSMLGHFCEKMAAKGKTVQIAEEMVSTWLIARHNEDSLYQLINVNPPGTQAKLRLILVKVLQENAPANMIPLSVNVSELLDETVNYFMPENAAPVAAPVVPRGPPPPTPNSGLQGINVALEKVKSMENLKKLDSMINVSIKEDPDAFDGRLQSLAPLQTFISNKMRAMSSQYGVSESYVDNVSTTIPKLLAHLDMCLFDMKRIYSLYGLEPLAESMTEKLSQYAAHFPTGVTVNYIVSIVSDFLTEACRGQ